MILTVSKILSSVADKPSNPNLQNRTHPYAWIEKSYHWYTLGWPTENNRRISGGNVHLAIPTVER